MEPRWHQLLARAETQRLAGDPNDALMALLAALDVLPQTMEELSARDAAQFAQAFAAAMGEARVDIGKPLFDALCVKHEDLSMVLAHAAPAAAIQLPHGEAGTAIASLLQTLDHLHDGTFAAAMNLPAPILQRLALAWLSTRAVFLPDGEARRQQVFRVVRGGLDLPQTPALRHLAATAWRLCSYSSATDKHSIKPTLGHWLAMPAAAAIAERASPRPTAPAGRPRIGIVLETLSGGHAMYRCYGPALQALALRADICVISLDHDPSRPAALRGTDDLAFDRQTPLATVALKIASRGFDALYFPSVGLRQAGITLANLRLAPVQIFSAGHPATTGAPTMDFALVSTDMSSSWAAFTEQVVVRFESIPQAPHPEMPPKPPVAVQRDVGTLNLAVPAITLKLSAAFLGALREIVDRAARPIHVHFFPNEAPTRAFALQRRLSPWFPRCTVHPRYAYGTLLEKLAACEMALSPWPFGNTNGAVDCAIVALPCLALRGDQPHGLTDARVLRLLGVEGDLLANGQHDYVERAVALIGSASDRRRIAALLGLDAVNLAIYRSTSPVPSGKPDFVDTILWLATEAPRHRPPSGPIEPSRA